jgi:hypothetical protein
VLFRSQLTELNKEILGFKEVTLPFSGTETTPIIPKKSTTTTTTNQVVIPDTKELDLDVTLPGIRKKPKKGDRTGFGQVQD